MLEVWNNANDVLKTLRNTKNCIDSCSFSFKLYHTSLPVGMLRM